MNEPECGDRAKNLSRLSAGRLAQVACLLEATARKPGNVHRFCDFAELHYLDFLLSATAIAGPLDQAVERGVGATVLSAVKATRQVVSTNTNLGIILLLAPLAAVPSTIDLGGGVRQVLAGTTTDDARLVYEAILLACPGGIGRVDEQDVAEPPTMPLRAVMALAADRDLIARQYASGFQEVLHEVLPMIRAALFCGQSLETAIIAAFLGTLARHPDSLIVRKAGREVALSVAEKAAHVIHAGWPGAPGSPSRLQEFDAWLRSRGNQLNPGTTADLVTAALFAALRGGTIPLPRPAGPASWSVGSDAQCNSRSQQAVSTSQFKVRVTKDYLVFCSGHFITYEGDRCERLHGHNYRAAVEVEGDLDENHYVVDFIALKDMTRTITDELDHRMLLPTRNQMISLHEDGANLRVTHGDRIWSFPRDECVLLPIANTTAELLADHIAGRLRQEMAARGFKVPRVLRVEVEESFGQSAEVEWHGE
jgi:triphosphoribosyl-dephospho-CoA synthase